MSATSDRLRIEFREGDALRDAGLTAPPDVLRRVDIPYGDDPARQSLDVYRPASAEGRTLPVIVSIHGGAWVYGDKELYQYYCMSLAQRGFAVVNFTYRLAPEFKYPAALEDANAVFGWVFDHAAEYGLDAGKICAVGDSAGAHMLALYACICTNPDYAARYAFSPPAGFAPRAVGLACGIYDIDVSEGSQHLELMEDLLPGGVTPEAMELISPLRHVTPAFPPTFLFTATGDYLRDQAAPFAQKLRENDVPFVDRLYGNAKTRPAHVFHVDMRNPIGKLCNDEQCAFFMRVLGQY